MLEITADERTVLVEFLVYGDRKFSVPQENGMGVKRVSAFKSVCLSPCGRFVARRDGAGKLQELLLARAPNGGVLCTDKQLVGRLQKHVYGLQELGGGGRERGRVVEERPPAPARVAPILENEPLEFAIPMPRLFGFDRAVDGREFGGKVKNMLAVGWVESLEKPPEVPVCPHPIIEEAIAWLREGR